MPPIREPHSEVSFDISSFGTEPRVAVVDESVLIDCELADARAGGKRAIAEELFALLCSTLPASLEELQEAGRHGDPGTMQEAVHRLKGAAEYCGVPRLQRDIRTLEKRLFGSMNIPEDPAIDGRNPADTAQCDATDTDRHVLDALCSDDLTPELAALYATMNALLETDGHLPSTTQPD